MAEDLRNIARPLIPSDILPDVQFSLFDTNNKTFYGKFQGLQNPKQKSSGTCQTMLEVHSLMNKSLAIVSPNILFTPDFPDYLLPVDHPNYIKTVPTTNLETNMKMPHHRNDLWPHDYNVYQHMDMIPTPQITWGLVRQEPGTMGGKAFTGIQERKPRTREYVAVISPNELVRLGMDSSAFEGNIGPIEYLVQIDGQAFDNMVQYNMWARSAWEVEELKEWFQEYMRKYTGLYMQAGVVQLLYERAARDDTLMQRKNGYHVRSLLYYFRTEHIHIHTVNAIKRIDTKILMSETPEELKYRNLDDNIITQDTLLSEWHN